MDLGQGSEPVRGRETVIGMAARLQSGTGALTVGIHDVNATIAEGGSADVDLTATLTRREERAREPSIDAREFELGMRKVNGDWLIARVTAVDPINNK